MVQEMCGQNCICVRQRWIGYKKSEYAVDKIVKSESDAVLVCDPEVDISIQQAMVSKGGDYIFQSPPPGYELIICHHQTKQRRAHTAQDIMTMVKNCSSQ